MSKSEQQRQRKLAKKKAKDRNARKVIIQRQQQLASLAGRMEQASKQELDGCYISKCCYDGTGLGTVLIVRRARSGERTFAVIVVDSLCLGVKDAFAKTCTSAELASFLSRADESDPLEPVEPGVARGYVEAAIEFAREHGFAPHGDYRKIAAIWGDIEATEVPEKFKFGRNGKPLYIAGPFDDPARQTFIINTLAQKLGPDRTRFVTTVDRLSNMDVEPLALRSETSDQRPDTIDGSVIQRIDNVQ